MSIASRIAFAFAVAAVLSGCAGSGSTYVPEGSDFACTLDGRDSLIIEDIDSIQQLRSGTWEVTAEAGRYLYPQRPGELCAVLP